MNDLILVRNFLVILVRNFLGILVYDAKNVRSMIGVMSYFMVLLCKLKIVGGWLKNEW